MENIPKNVHLERHDFSKIKTYLPIPNLISIQLDSYNKFLQMEKLPEDRKEIGLQAAFKSVFDIEDFRGKAKIEFVEYRIGNWECKCGFLKGEEHNRFKCKKCKKNIYVKDPTDKYVICEFCGYRNEAKPDICPKCETPVELKLDYTVEESESMEKTYSVPLKVKFRLTVFDVDSKGERTVKDVKEKEIFFGEIPIMTKRGTFIFNGTERVIVNQLNRSPGVFYKKDKDKNSYILQIIPYRGAWIEFEFDKKEIMYIRIDRKRKFNAGIFLRCFGLLDEDFTKTETFLKRFYTVHKMKTGNEEDLIYLSPSIALKDKRVAADVFGADGKKVLSEGNKFKKSTLRKVAEDSFIPFNLTEFDIIRNVEDILNPETGEVLYPANSDITIVELEKLRELGIEEINVILPKDDIVGPVLSNTLQKDGVKDTNDALIDLYRKLRPGDPPTLESARKLFISLCFDRDRYDLSRVGRLKFNTKLGVKTDLDQKELSIEDILLSLDYYFKIPKGIGDIDDIDHLSNRRIRSVGELLENQFRVGLVRVQKAIKEKMSIMDDFEQVTPSELISPKPVMAILREFFGQSQLSQFMDQTNILSEITHKRRLSSLGPGGLSRERAGFEVRDVHPSHYGRICPIETPEGPNIGLIVSLACYAKVNEFGFIETPYKKVENGRVLDHVKIIFPGDSKNYKVGDIILKEEYEAENKKLEKDGKLLMAAEPYVFYLSAWEEDKYKIAQANAPRDENNYITVEQVNARVAGESKLIPKDEIDFIDVSPKQIVSIAASLIPFLEHDDANRALMGSNMQRQAVPLLRTEAPFVGTGMEHIVAKDSGLTVVAKRSGWVEAVDGQRIVVRVDSKEANQDIVGVDIYPLVKFKRSNQDTCFNQKPIVKKGDYVHKGQIIADGPGTDRGELALGRNVLVAFMPWRGYNFEDAILVSEKIVKEDVYTSIHIEELEIEARDTKLGPEEITRDIPNVNEEFLKDLDDSGIIRIGAKVKPGDILVGKVTPKGESTPSPEEKLLKAIFGAKAEDVKDASLRTPPGMEGTVVDVKIFARKGVEKDERAKQIERERIEALEKDFQDKERIIRIQTKFQILSLIEGMKLKEDFVDKHGNLVAKKGTKVTEDFIEAIGIKDSVNIKVGNKKVEEEVKKIVEKFDEKIEIERKVFEKEVEKLKKGDELPAGVIKMVKVYIAVKRKLSEGDKMAGRHGNKGVVSRILPEEDMPYLPDGTPVDIVLNPLGVPSRMNVGQILETHLGWAAKALNMHFATPVFDGASSEDIKFFLKKAGLPESGQIFLYDGKTGERFDQPVTVGYMYLLKLHHLVDNKIHARSIGPYSLITQQPLGGKAQFGGQRFGEMEVWALEAYGAAYTLQEMLTYKSDDVQGRNKIYEAIVKGHEIPEPGIPESFNVLMKEIMSLCLNLQFNVDQEEELEGEEGEEPLGEDDIFNITNTDTNDN